MTSTPPHSANAPKRKALSPSTLDFPVVGIGASAGGLQAIKLFFENMPHDNGMAFVIILHLSPDHQSIADRIIQESTRMPVLQVTETVPIEKNHIYVISPARQLTMNDGVLEVSSNDRSEGRHASIDLFFRDLAEVHRERAFCLVLSGSGSDGAVGLSRIKEHGGITMAQMPEDAEFDGMPRAAIETGMVDLVLPVVEMPQKLLELWHNSQEISLPTANDPELQSFASVSERDAAVAEQLLHDILIQLRTGTGHDFKHYKRATVLRRIERRMQVTAQPDLAAYYRYLQNNPEETKALLGDMLIGVTNFFRDREAFEALERDVLPQLVSAVVSAHPEKEEIRVWSAGCSTGEEAYSLAMLISDQLQLDASKATLQLFATDIDERAISVGRAGLYPQAIVTDVPPTRLRNYFVKEDDHYRIRKELREKVLFAKHSLLSDPPFSQIDLIVCRNLLIYLDREVQREILQMFHFALRPGGFLFLGSSESADACHELFATVDKRNRIFRAKTGTASSRRTPTMPRGGYVRTNVSREAPQNAVQRKLSFSDIHQRALERTAPPSMIVDANADILHMSGSAGRFLRHVGGELSRNLLTLILPELRLEIRTTLFQVQQSGLAVKSRAVPITRDNRRYKIDLLAQPYKDEESEGEFVLVIFEEAEIDPAEQEATTLLQTESQVLSNLERELQRTKLHLQDTIEQSEVSSEELKASNEEMQAINEELRSATEELETSKEELQSINEELLTVNYELKTKVEETDKINDYLTNLIASTDIATVFVDRDMRIKWFTPRATDIFSMLPVDTGRSLLDITHRLQYDDLAKDAALVFESLNMIEREISSTDNRWYIARLLPYRSSEDHIDGTVLTFIDITKRRAAEDELRLSEERMRLVAESTRDYAIITLDEQGVITSWNKGAELIFGYSKVEAEGVYYDFIFSEEDRASGLPKAELQKVHTQGRSEDERWYLRKDGRRFYCSGEVTLLTGDNLRGYVKIARDLTGHKRQHEEQSQALAETRNTSYLKDEFFAVMSHELKHPLNLIQLNAELLRRLPVTKAVAPAAKAVNTICDAVTSQARIIDDLLDVARVRTGKLKLQAVTVDLVSVLRDIHTVVLNEQHETTVELQVPSQPLMVHADPTRLEQIIWNLVNNALKFTPPTGRVQLIASQDGAKVRLDVKDNGTGIAPENLEHVFDLFGQAEKQHVSHHREGLGIGLSLVRQLTEAQQGTVEVSSPGLGAGCTFSVCLPMARTDGEANSALRLDDEATGRLSGLTILLVDDSADVLETLKVLLEMEDAEVIAFDRPAEALDAAKSMHFDLIISDLGMPVMSGHELMSALRQLPFAKDVPAIALTGYGAHSDITKSRQSGFDQHVGKPVSYEELIETIEALRSKSVSMGK
ncbi:two-component system, chemotaxis family, CheB/CheR fusion protein [Pseudomonas arsenicoxydans]|uniref:histidine kinase n=1 Tax=Pseudomonas arsenicoxydans TaxID=702115 RepID=A0A1H0SHW7_9PSED|nr:CheR family methyltransferase [Pseudomonas arsenicoxydans]SDP40746.1 two-component system, chemotaxis family, CheB/CheR fusion protein [Pseudomonas arsenicoxydans]